MRGRCLLVLPIREVHKCWYNYDVKPRISASLLREQGVKRTHHVTGRTASGNYDNPGRLLAGRFGERVWRLRLVCTLEKASMNCQQPGVVLATRERQPKALLGKNDAHPVGNYVWALALAGGEQAAMSLTSGRTSLPPHLRLDGIEGSRLQRKNIWKVVLHGPQRSVKVQIGRAHV